MGNIKETSTNFENNNVLENKCSEIYAINLISGKWILSICYYLKFGKFRFSELRDKIPNITERMLTLQLKRMEKSKLVRREVFPEVPLKVEYELTALGKGLLPIMEQLRDWGEIHKKEMLIK